MIKLTDYILLGKERDKISRAYKLNTGDRFTVDADIWEDQYGLVSPTYNYAYTEEGRIVLKLIGVGNISTKKHWWEFWKRKKTVYEFEVTDLARYEE